MNYLNRLYLIVLLNIFSFNIYAQYPNTGLMGSSPGSSYGSYAKPGVVTYTKTQTTYNNPSPFSNGVSTYPNHGGSSYLNGPSSFPNHGGSSYSNHGTSQYGGYRPSYGSGYYPGRGYGSYGSYGSYGRYGQGGSPYMPYRPSPMADPGNRALAGLGLLASSIVGKKAL
uniref:Secreted protein n=1 Tax=Parastrongyloides trichosuri TaxID=131310 RepID=A0A0N4ZJY4_PARTI